MLIYTALFLKIICGYIFKICDKIVLVPNIVIGCSVDVVITGSVAFAQTSMLMKQWDKIFSVELVYLYVSLSICLSIYLSIYLYLYLYLYIYINCYFYYILSYNYILHIISIYLSIYPSIYIYIYIYIYKLLFLLYIII